MNLFDVMRDHDEEVREKYQVLLISQPDCEYCTLARSLLRQNFVGTQYTEFGDAVSYISASSFTGTLIRQYAGFKTVPQIYWRPDRHSLWMHIGGYNELMQEFKSSNYFKSTEGIDNG